MGSAHAYVDMYMTIWVCWAAMMLWLAAVTYRAVRTPPDVRPVLVLVSDHRRAPGPALYDWADDPMYSIGAPGTAAS